MKKIEEIYKEAKPEDVVKAIEKCTEKYKRALTNLAK